MKTNKTGNLKAALMAALLCLGAASARAGVVRDVDRDVDKITHALGWDSLDLKTVDQDAQGRPTRERDSNLVNLVERRTEYFSNGNKSSRTLTVVAKDSGKTLYSEKETWTENGDRASVDKEDDLFDAAGKQMNGRLVERQYHYGKLAAQDQKRYSAVTGDWGVTLRQTIAYYKDGDMKERVSEYPAADEKTRDTWGARRGALGRKEYVEQWNPSRGVWE